MTAHDDRARDEQDPRRAMTAPEIFAKLRERPAPTARETAADELAEAERELDAAREALGYIEHGADDTAALERHAAALNRRNALRKADELTKAERWARKYALYAEMAPSSRRMVTLMAEYDERGRERDAARAEAERLREELRQADEFGRGEFRVTQHAYDQAVRTIDDLRGRDEAAKAVAQWWREIGSGTPTEKRLRERLNALARAHETEGQDR